MIAVLASLLGILAVGSWITALSSALALWRLVPAGHPLKSIWSLGWLQFDTIRQVAGPEADRYSRRYVYALVVFFVTIAAFVALAVAIIVTGQNA